MSFELTARTEAGAGLVALAVVLAEALAEGAAPHDRDASYPFECVDALKEAGVFVAPVPVHLGGLGVSSVHDLLVAASRLARGNASVAIGVNMHLVALLSMVRRWQTAVAAGNERRAAAFARSLETIVGDGVVMAAAISERGQDLTRPATTAVRTASGFCTMAPAADVFYTAVRFADEAGVERYGYAFVPADAPGVVVHDDWDALGMRASGSNSVSFSAVELPAAALRGGFEVGDPIPYMERNLAAGLFHASASLGIAEAASAVALQSVARRAGAADTHTRMLAATNAIELAGCRAAFGRAAVLLDDHYDAHPGDDGTRHELVALFAETQATKTHLNEAAARIVDRALALSGGAGYLNGSVLARAYRDVRAGAFMHPLGANRAYELIGQVALGLEPALH
jgi:alkylation response protein AidB-like acyl-CoA dehydrogenase